MVLAPFLAATAIAGEREQGTLALASPEPPRLVGGKLWSALSFIARMVLVPRCCLTMLVAGLCVIALKQPEPRVAAHALPGLAALAGLECLALAALHYAMRHGLRQPERWRLEPE